jgi:tetratricopeptide (TPR) repeat protein
MRYAAFISYSNIDRAIGERIHKALESYVVPGALQGQDFGRGPVPRRITPIFRDRWDADASSDLGATLRTALEASDALIVLCSPAAARSAWVSEEIRVFKRVGREDRIYPVLIDGQPRRFDPEREPEGAFPPALFDRWSDAQWLREEREPLAPDARPEGDGLRFTVLKLVAALTGIPLTTLAQRQAEAERQARNRARLVAGVMTFLAIGAIAGAWISWQATLDARKRLDNAIEMAARRVDDAAGFRDRYGVPRGVITELLDGAKKDFDELTQDGGETPMLGLQRARLERQLSHIHEARGASGKQKDLAVLALERLANVPTQRRVSAPSTWFARLPPADMVEAERILALEAVGQAKAAEGDVAGARASFEQMARTADAMLARSGQRIARSLAANARSNLGRLSYDAGDLERALKELREARSVLTSDPGDSTFAPDLAKIQSDEAEMLLELGRHADALAIQQASVTTLEKVAASTPENAGTLAAAIARRGDMRLAANRDLEGARADYIKAQSILAELVASDAARTDWKRELSLTHERVGGALLQAREIEGAREAFASCLALRRELVARDPSHVEWRRDLSVALERVGNVESLRGRHDAAIAALTEALKTRETAFGAKPDDVVARRDLAIVWLQLAKARLDARSPQTQVDAAYARAIDLLTGLVEKAAAESRWRRDLAVAYADRGEARRKAGNRSGARADMEAALGLIRGLRKVAPDDTQLANDETWLQARLR